MHQLSFRFFVRCLLVAIAIGGGRLSEARHTPATYVCPPRLTIIFVVDSFAAHYVNKLQDNFRYGLAALFNNGVVFTNAYWPHGTPITAPGHTGLSTGAFGSATGIISNAWYDRQGNKIEADGDPSPEAAVIDPKGGLYNYGKSPHNIMAESLSDSLMLNTTLPDHTKVISVGIKSRATIGTATKHGTPYWFDKPSGMMTSSRYYMQSLPAWLIDFNASCQKLYKGPLSWELMYDHDDECYAFDWIARYDFSSCPEPIAGCDIAIDASSTEPFDVFERTPLANKLLLDCAKQCIKEHVCHDPASRLLVWICLSPLDVLAHRYGPQSLEVVDMIYHLDYQLKYFMRSIQKYYRRCDTLYVLTADHGVLPIVERVREHGNKQAYRISPSELSKKIACTLNEATALDFKIRIKYPNVYFSKEFFELDKAGQKMVLDVARGVLLSEPGVKNVWTPYELRHIQADDFSPEYLYRNQLFDGRSGQLIIHLYPFCQLIEYPKGTTHQLPYEADMHVPLVVYRHKYIEGKIINEKVSMLQCANTIAQILNIPKPSSSPFKILPGIFPDLDECF